MVGHEINIAAKGQRQGDADWSPDGRYVMFRQTTTEANDDLIQKRYRNPSSISRGRLICVTGTTPNSEEAGEVLGAPKIGVFVRLKAETLNCISWPSRILKFRITVASYCGREYWRIVVLRSFEVRRVSGSCCTQMLGEVLNQ